MKILVRTISFLALAFLVGASAFAVAGSQSAPVEAREECATREVPLDEGYGVTRVELREVCAR
ncbi:MAG: hypothetical protein JWN07_2512 [Hyphomicrobiales bacterium]|nr:hypothetical protein [Hyphomicrobiales bacterium]